MLLPKKTDFAYFFCSKKKLFIYKVYSPKVAQKSRKKNGTVDNFPTRSPEDRACFRYSNDLEKTYF